LVDDVAQHHAGIALGTPKRLPGGFGKLVGIWRSSAPHDFRVLDEFTDCRPLLMDLPVAVVVSP
jgi:hypothetical protein